MTTPVGVIVMAVHHPRLDLLERQVRSLQGQSDESWSCIIGIDGDDPVVAGALDRLVGTDLRFGVHAFPDNLGVYRHFERLLALVPSHASWVALSDQDDSWHPDKLVKLVEVLRNEGISAVSCQASVVTDDGAVRSSTRRRTGGLLDTLMRNQLTGCFTVLDPSVVDLALPFPDTGSSGVHDHWLAVVASVLGTVEVVDEVLMDYVQHGSNQIGEHQPAPRVVLAARARTHGGWRQALDVATNDFWERRVAMAAAVAERCPALGPDARTVGVLAAGYADRDFRRRLIASICAGRIGGRSAVIATLAAWRHRKRR